MIELKDLTVRFGGVTALDAVSAVFTAPVSGIIGPNGAGKTTTMNVVSGFLPAAGSILYNGEVISRLSPHQRARWGLRRSFQREQIADDLSVIDNLRVMLDTLPGSSSQKRADAENALRVCGLEGRAHTLAATLNTYERRLTDVARCLVGSPKIVMLDEPAGGLTQEETQHLGDLILKIHPLTGASTLLIDHDVDLISRICEQTLVLDFGRRIALGPTQTVLEDPNVQAAYLGMEEVN
ncbi:MAG: ATP-binding cassette domain-containing protein [Pseudomonadota bacterium]